MIPQTIGRYQIKDTLGAGGMGIVYRAYDPHLLREVALKVIFQGEFRRLSDDKQKQVLGRFLQEAKIVASLHHPAIIPIYDFGYQNGEPFIVMPLMRGGLDDHLENEPLDLDEIVRILELLAPALDKLHEKNIVHRDLKPSNILFDEENKPYIADFGIARLTEETMIWSQTGQRLGTPAYMSPEQARGDEDLDGRSDIYSLGGMLYKMLTGERPYHRVHPDAVLYFHMNEPPPRLDDDDISVDLPTEYQAIIDCAMAKTKEERYNSASELLEALKAVVLGGRSPRQSNPSPQQATSQLSDTQRAVGYFRQGLTAYNKDDYDQAIACYNQAIRLNPNYADAYINRGIAYRKKGDYDQAIANYDQAIRLNPDDADAYINRGNAHTNKGNYSQAIADYDQAIRLNPDFALAYNNRGWAYYNKGNYSQAIADYDQVIYLNSDYVNAYYNRGYAYRMKGNYDQAIADYDQAIRLNPDYATAYNNRAVVYEKKGNTKQAISDYKKTLALNNN